ncbi:MULTISPECIES: hypothetical protein [unclassified Nonomuraea]|uniref:hypothetical protein n=1 Tax=unclassified Nonomuraea TaxID=2593643 RepID=UPI00137651EC|nr:MULTISPECIES: hypothetical protein [unclassified Nonomuraea]NBE92321.1 hypothetical protein [Nonomuraea sp. K271]
MRTEESPRLARGLAWAAGDVAVVVEGAPERHVFRGKAAKEVLARVVPLIDGTRSLEELRRETGLSARHLDQVLALLGERGLLESPDEGDDLWPDREAATYFSRNLSETGGYASSENISRHLARCTVVVLGDALIAGEVMADMRALGVGRVRSELSASEAEGRVFVIVIDQPAQPDVLAEAAAWCGPRGIPVMRAAASLEFVELGPCFLLPYTACVACVGRGRADAGWEAGTATRPGPRDVASGLITTEALGLLLGLPETGAPRLVTRIALSGWTKDRRLALPYPDCEDCGTTHSAADSYEWTIASDSPAFRRRASVTPGRIKQIDSLMTERPDFPSHPSSPLPVEGAQGQAALLGDLLRRTAGLRPDRDDRWVPSGGNLGSVEMYVISDAGLHDLPGTVFRYDDLNDRYIAIRPDRVPLATVLRQVELPTDEVSALLVFVAASSRLEKKYQTASHRLALLDAGCATTQLSVVAGHHRLGIDHATAWTEDLADVLCLVPDQFVTAVAGIHRPTSEELPHAADLDG